MILLNTQVLLWLLAAPERLSPAARTRIEQSAVTYFSAVSIAERAIKRMIGRLDVPLDLDRILTEQGLSPLTLTAEHTTGLDNSPVLARHAPFDRLLLAQAKVEKLHDQRCPASRAGARLDCSRRVIAPKTTVASHRRKGPINSASRLSSSPCAG